MKFVLFANFVLQVIEGQFEITFEMDETDIEREGDEDDLLENRFCEFCILRRKIDGSTM